VVRASRQCYPSSTAGPGIDPPLLRAATGGLVVLTFRRGRFIRALRRAVFWLQRKSGAADNGFGTAERSRPALADPAGGPLSAYGPGLSDASGSAAST
jgi:hypothetical protein